MMEQAVVNDPQVGPREAGESHPSHQVVEGCPSYSGGGNNCSEGQQSADVRKNDLGQQKPDTDSHPDDGNGSKTSGSTLPPRDSKGRFLRSKKRLERRSGQLKAPCERPTDLLKDNLEMSCSDSDTLNSLEEISSREVSPGGKGQKRPKADGVESGDEGEESAPVPKLNTAQRGRGRPPTTGKYVGRAKVLADLEKSREETLFLEAEREMELELGNLSASSTCSSASRKRTDAAAIDEVSEKDLSVDSQELEGRVLKAIEVIGVVARKSSNLKGTWQRALKVAAENIKKVVTELRSRSITEEVAKLQEDNARLKATLETLKDQVSNWQRPAPATSSDEFRRSLIVELGSMMDAKLAGVEDRLLPSPRLRPPLAADKRVPRTAVAETEVLPHLPQSSDKPVAAPHNSKNAAKTPKTVPPTAQPNESRGKTQEKENKRRKKKKGKKSTPNQQPTTSEEPRLPSQPRPVNEGWNVVARRGTKLGTTAAAASKTKETVRLPKLRPPRSSAVVLTLQAAAVEKGVTYANVLAEAKSRINLASLGIDSLKFRTAATGARILQLPGATSAEKANLLADKLRESLGDEVVRVSRPERYAELRISDLDDSVTKEEVVAAVASACDCPAVSIKTGEVKRSLWGTGTIWVRCPVVTAKTLSERGHILVGWTSARVRLLELRPLRCFRCLEWGHVGAKCRAEVDRSNFCFCCGRPGHRAAHCSADPHCPICEAANKPANHRLGSKNCSSAPPKQRTNRGGRSRKPTDRPRAPSRAQRRHPGQTEGEEMDVVPQ